MFQVGDTALLIRPLKYGAGPTLRNAFTPMSVRIERIISYRKVFGTEIAQYDVLIDGDVCPVSYQGKGGLVDLQDLLPRVKSADYAVNVSLLPLRQAAWEAEQLAAAAAAALAAAVKNAADYKDIVPGVSVAWNSTDLQYYTYCDNLVGVVIEKDVVTGVAKVALVPDGRPGEARLSDIKVVA